MLCVLKGATVFAADLMRDIWSPITQVEFIEVASYGENTTSSGTLRINQRTRPELAGKHVLIVEDIIETGLTLGFLLDEVARSGAASVAACTLLRKPPTRFEEQIRYVGWDIPPDFVVGYGMDFAERYRNLPYVAVLLDGEEAWVAAASRSAITPSMA